MEEAKPTAQIPNKIRAGQIKAWKVKNKIQISEYNKLYYQKNKKECGSYTCQCGKNISVNHKPKHEQTKYHMSRVNI